MQDAKTEREFFAAFREQIERNEGSHLSDEELFDTALSCLRELQWRIPLDGVRQGELHEGYREAAVARRSIANELEEKREQMFTIHDA